jgi:hypothetical protein
MLLAGVCVIIAGLLQLFNRDMAWKSTQGVNNLKGVKSERTKAWEYSSAFQAIMAIIVGFVLLALCTQMGSSRSNSINSSNSSNSSNGSRGANGNTGFPSFRDPSGSSRYFDKDGNEIVIIDKTPDNGNQQRFGTPLR